MVTYDQLAEAQSGRLVSDIPMDDPYWDVLQAFRMEQVRRDPGIGEKKFHPNQVQMSLLQERLTLRAAQDDERRRLEEEEKKKRGDDEDDDEEVELEDEDDDDPEPPSHVSKGQGTGMEGLDDESLRALSLSGDKSAAAELKRRG